MFHAGVAIMATEITIIAIWLKILQKREIFILLLPIFAIFSLLKE